MEARWLHLSGSGGSGHVLAIDFDGSGRQEATFRDLARLLPAHLSVWHALAPPDAYQTARPGPGQLAERYLAWWGGCLPCEHAAVAAVLGYCAGSVYASALADRIEATGCPRPTVVLFNPGPPSVDTVHRDVSGIVASITILAQTERSELLGRISAARDRYGADFDRVSNELAAIYLRACDQAISALGIDPDIGDELTGLFKSYLLYLSAARQIPYQSGWKSGSSLCSSDHTSTSFTNHELVFDLRRSELLRSRIVAAAAADILLTG